MLTPKLALSRGMIILLVVMSAVIVASVVVGVIVIVNTINNNNVVITPDYAPEEMEPNVEKIEGDEQGGGDKMETVGGGGGAMVIWKEECIIDLSDEKVTFYYANPKKSTTSTVLKVKIHGEIVAVSGRIDPGYRLQTLDLLKGAKSKLGGPGGYEGEILLEFYDEKSGEKSLVNTALPFTITVQE